MSPIPLPSPCRAHHPGYQNWMTPKQRDRLHDRFQRVLHLAADLADKMEAGRIDPNKADREALGAALERLAQFRDRPVGNKLRLPQVRILKALAKAKFLLDQQRISENAPVARGHLGDHVGLVDPKKREDREKVTGFPSLLTLGYVNLKRIKQDGDMIVYKYEITPAGSKAMAAARKG